MEKWIERIPRKVGKIITWGLLVFMCCNIMVSCMALVRYDERKKGIRAETRWEHWTDEHYDDVKMKKIYPNAKGVKKGKTEEKMQDQKQQNHNQQKKIALINDFTDLADARSQCSFRLFP